MPKPSTGELRRLATGWAALITIQGRTRRQFVLACRSEEEAEARTRALATIASRVRRAGRVAELPKLLEGAAQARGRAWLAVLEAVDAIAAGGVEGTRAESIPTFAVFAERWTSGELHRRFPDHVKKKADTTRDEELLRIYVNSAIGDDRLDLITLDDADRVMAEIPEERSPGTRRHVAQVVRRVLSLAVYPARLIAASPIPPKWLPRVHGQKAKECLFPDEDRTLLAAPTVTVPLLRRLAYGFLAREGMRTDELASLRWRDVDLKRGRIILDENKTDDPRDWALDGGVLRALKVWRERFHEQDEADAHVFAERGVPLNVEHIADQFRRDLKRAGVSRPELFERSTARQPIRAHDLRATFVTVSLATGKTETWVADRTGHKSSNMINRYRRKARTWSGMSLGELVPLDQAIPELRKTPSPSIATSIATKNTRAGGETGRRSGFRWREDESDSSGAAQNKGDALPSSPEIERADVEKWRSDGNPEPPITPRGDALASLYAAAASLDVSDLAGARAIHEAIGKLLGDPAHAVAQSTVVDINERRRGR